MSFKAFLVIVFIKLNACCCFDYYGSKTKQGKETNAHEQQDEEHIEQVQDPQDTEQRVSDQKAMDDEIWKVINQADYNTALYRFTRTTADELKAYVELVINLDDGNDLIQRSFVSDGDVFVLKYLKPSPTINTQKIITCSIIQNHNGYFRWVDVDLNPVQTGLKSYESILTNHARVHDLRIDPEGRICYPISNEVTKELKAMDFTIGSCQYYNGEMEWDQIYTEFVSKNDFYRDLYQDLKLQLNPNCNALSSSNEFELLWPDYHYFLAWKDRHGKWQNIVLKLEEYRLVKIGTARDLSAQSEIT